MSITGLAALMLAGCAPGFSGAGSNEDLRDRFVQAVERQERGRPFTLGEVLPGDWTGAWFFGGYTTPDIIEGTVGAPWDGAPSEVPEGAVAMVVKGPGSTVTGFMFDTGKIFKSCLPDDLEASRPNDEFVLLGPVPGEDRPDWNLLSSVRPAEIRACTDLHPGLPDPVSAGADTSALDRAGSSRGGATGTL